MRATGIFAIGIALAGGLAPAAPAAAESGRCAVRGTTTVEQTKDVRVYYRGVADEHRLYACYERTGRKRPLGRYDQSEGPGVVGPTVAGRFVAYQSLRCENDCADSDVRVMDVRTGSVRRSAKAGPGAHRLGGLVLKRTGSVAWIRAFLDRSAEVRKLQMDGEHLVDQGEVELNSLALASSRIYWTRGTTPFSAPLE